MNVAVRVVFGSTLGQDIGRPEKFRGLPQSPHPNSSIEACQILPSSLFKNHPNIRRYMFWDTEIPPPPIPKKSQVVETYGASYFIYHKHYIYAFPFKSCALTSISIHCRPGVHLIMASVLQFIEFRTTRLMNNELETTRIQSVAFSSNYCSGTWCSSIGIIPAEDITIITIWTC
jgi:hypothetical protein